MIGVFRLFKIRLYDNFVPARFDISRHIRLFYARIDERPAVLPNDGSAVDKNFFLFMRFTGEKDFAADKIRIFHIYKKAHVQRAVFSAVHELGKQEPNILHFTVLVPVERVFPPVKDQNIFIFRFQRPFPSIGNNFNDFLSGDVPCGRRCLYYRKQSGIIRIHLYPAPRKSFRRFIFQIETI